MNFICFVCLFVYLCLCFVSIWHYSMWVHVIIDSVNICNTSEWFIYCCVFSLLLIMFISLSFFDVVKGGEVQGLTHIFRGSYDQDTKCFVCFQNQKVGVCECTILLDMFWMMLKLWHLVFVYIVFCCLCLDVHYHIMTFKIILVRSLQVKLIIFHEKHVNG